MKTFLVLLLAVAGQSWAASIPRTSGETVEGAIRGQVVFRISRENQARRSYVVLRGQDILSIDENRLLPVAGDVRAVVIDYYSDADTPGDQTVLSAAGVLLGQIGAGATRTQVEGKRLTV